MPKAKDETPEQRARRLELRRGYNFKRRGGPYGPYRQTVEQKRVTRINTLRKWKFNLTPEQWQAMFEAQGNKCAICKRADPDHAKGWVVDHCHSTNRVRGILCARCNVGLGNFKDSSESLVNAAKYLKAEPVVGVFANPDNTTKSWAIRNALGPGRTGRPRRVTEEQRAEAVQLHANGMTFEAIAKLFGCSGALVSKIVRTAKPKIGPDAGVNP